VEPVLPLRLSQGGSLYLTRPTLGHYTASRDELESRADDLFSWIGEGKLNVLIGRRLAISAAREAHELIQGRATTGKVLLVP